MPIWLYIVTVYACVAGIVFLLLGCLIAMLGNAVTPRERMHGFLLVTIASIGWPGTLCLILWLHSLDKDDTKEDTNAA